jgi:hypothetical protein
MQVNHLQQVLGRGTLLRCHVKHLVDYKVIISNR